MTEQERRGWVIVAGLFLIQAVLWGAVISTLGVFFNPLMKAFGANHAQVARTITAYSLAGMVAPVAGWLLDRFRVQLVMAAGALMAGVAFLVASQAHSLWLIVAMYVLIGVGGMTGAYLPAVVVSANWFEERRGLAIGVAISGLTLGIVLAPPLVAHVILHYGWRWGMVCLGIPILVIAIPLDFFVMRLRTGSQRRRSPTHEIEELPGLELRPAMGTSAFWFLNLAEFFFMMMFGSVFFFIVPYLIKIGFGAQHAATIFGIENVLAAPGFWLIGALEDHYGPKLVMYGSLVCLVLSIVGLMGAAVYLPFIALFLAFWAATAGASATILPVLLAQSLGLRRFGTFMGSIRLSGAIGQAVAPLIVGVLVDMTGRYSPGFELAIGYCVVTAIFTAIVYPAEGHDAIAPEVSVAAGAQ